MWSVRYYLIVKAMSEFEDETKTILEAIEALRRDVKALETSEEAKFQRLSSDIQVLRDELGNLSISTSPLRQGTRKSFFAVETLAIVLPFVGLIFGFMLYFSSQSKNNKNNQNLPAQDNPAQLEQSNPQPSSPQTIP